MAFKRNLMAARQLAQGAKMQQYLEAISEEAATEVDRRLRHRQIFDGLEVTHAVERSSGGWQGRVAIEGAGWHFWEFGTRNHAALPALRPGVQAVLSRHRGKFKTQ